MIPTKPFKSNKLLKFFIFLGLALAVFLLIAPFWGELILPFQKIFDRTGGYSYSNNLSDNTQSDIDKSVLKPPPEDNILVIPKIGVDSKIIESESDSVLNSGIWRKPNSSIPPKGGNTVLTAHRFQYLNGPNTFYHLDKLEVGDKFFLYWEGQEFDYEIISKNTVSPLEVSIEDNTSEEIITLYTCTYNAQSRIVIRAKRIILASSGN